MAKKKVLDWILAVHCTPILGGGGKQAHVRHALPATYKPLLKISDNVNSSVCQAQANPILKQYIVSINTSMSYSSQLCAGHLYPYTAHALDWLAWLQPFVDLQRREYAR